MGCRKHYCIFHAFQESPNGCCDNSTGDTILHAAALLGEAKLVSALAHYRPIINVDVKNNKGNHQIIQILPVVYITFRVTVFLYNSVLCISPNIL